MITTSQAFLGGALGLLLAAEAYAPFYPRDRGGLRRWLRHDFRNLAFGCLNAVMGTLFFGGLLAAVDAAARAHGFGLVRWLGWSGPGCWVLTLLLFDCWVYWWHRLNHAVPALWRFHSVHHMDPAMDATSGVRFHPGEVLLSGLTRLAVLPLIGMTIEQLAAYAAVATPVALAQHANVRLPRAVDFGLFRIGLLVTPAMHRVHHSSVREETNSNYSAVLSVWDLLFGSMRARRDLERIRFGVESAPVDGEESLRGMLAAPLRRVVRRHDG